MRILLATYSLREWTGSELFTVDLARALARRGHEVTVHAPLIGRLGRRLAAEGFVVSNRLSRLSVLDLDVAHVHHNVVTMAVRAALPELPLVMLLHGVSPDIERPPSADLRLARILGVSEEVVEHARDCGAFDAATEVVRNFIDTDRWSASRPIGRKLKRILVLSNDYSPDTRRTVETACSLVGAACEHVGLPENSQADVRPYIEKADLVITLGRGVLEASAMGRNVLVHGSRGGDGFVDEQTFGEFRKSNFSGRTRGIEFTPEALAVELSRYDPRLGPRLREIVRAEHEESVIVDRLEEIYRQVAGEQVAPAGEVPLLKEGALLYEELCNHKDLCDHLQELPKHELDTARAELAAMRASTSWRLTAPLRLLGSLFRGSRRD